MKKALFLLAAIPLFNMPTGAAVAADAWTITAEQLGLFNPHENYCDTSTELFLEVGASGRGFCIESSARSAALWINAKEDCLDEKKRLPELAEWYYACRNLTGFSAASGTSNAEWASNYDRISRNDNTSKTGNAVPVAGNVNNCSYGNVGWIGYWVNGETPEPSVQKYRCVR